MNVFVSRLATRLLAVAAVALGLGFGSAAEVQAAEVRFLYLKCIAPQERDADGDEVRLHILSDSFNGKGTYDHDGMKAGDSWPLNGLNVLFRNAVRVELWERDPRNADEFLGAGMINPVPGTYFIRFNRHGANYELHFQVVP